MMKWQDETQKGFKFLDPLGATYYNGKPFYYTLPRADQKWGDWQTHPEAANKLDKNSDCGPGGFHVMKNLSARYAPDNWWVWFAEGRGVIGESGEKFRCREIRLRRIPIKVLWKIARNGTLHSADLHSADLRSANLRSADLSYADLHYADLHSANLRSADLSSANLRSADLSYADLRYADLHSADLHYADLHSADLRSANLRSADLSYARNWKYALMNDATRKLFEKANG